MITAELKLDNVALLRIEIDFKVDLSREMRSSWSFLRYRIIVGIISFVEGFKFKSKQVEALCAVNTNESALFASPEADYTRGRFSQQVQS